MKQYVLNALSDGNFRVKAFASYLADCADNYSKILQFIDACINYDFDDEDVYYDHTFVSGNGRGDTLVTDAVAELLQEYELAGNALVTLPNGYAKLGDLGVFIMNQTIIYSKDDWINENHVDPMNLEYSNVMVRKTSMAYDLQNKISATQVLDTIRSTFHSAIVLQAAAAASIYDSAVERLTVFKDAVADKFENVYDDISNTYSYFKGLLLEKTTSAQTVIANIKTALGIDQLADDDSMVSQDALVYQYTGANPVGCIDFSSAARFVGSTGKVIANATKNIVNGIVNIGKRIFSWVRNKVITTFDNPMDLNILNGDSKSWTIDGFCVPVHDYITGQVSESSLTFDEQDAIADWVVSQEGKWFKYDFVFAEVMFKLFNMDKNGNTYSGDIDIYIKPKCLNPESVIPFLASCLGGTYDFNQQHTVQYGPPVMQTCEYYYTDAGSFYNKTLAQYEAIMSKLSDFCNVTDLYLDPSDTNEKMCYAGFALSWQLLSFALKVAGEEQKIPSDASPSYVLSDWYTGDFIYNWWCSHPSDVTNLDFVVISSGYKAHMMTMFDMSHINDSGHNIEYFNNVGLDHTMINTFVDLLVNQRVDRMLHPTEYAFIPYQNNVESWSKSRLSIKTDKENQDAATNFLTVMVAIIIIVVVCATAMVAIKRIAKKRWWKMTEFTAKKDNQMWSTNTPLTKKEKRRYLRYIRRLNASDMLTRGMVTTVTGAVEKGQAVYGSIQAMVNDNSTVGINQMRHDESVTQGIATTKASQDSVNTLANDLAALRRLIK